MTNPNLIFIEDKIPFYSYNVDILCQLKLRLINLDDINEKVTTSF